MGGSQLVSIRMAEELGDAVQLSTPVRRIEHSSDGVLVVADGMEVRARRVIVAIPPALCGRIGYEPALPGYRDQLTQRMPQGSVIKCMAVYDVPFWRDEGLSGEAVPEARRCSGLGGSDFCFVRPRFKPCGRIRAAARVFLGDDVNHAANRVG